MNYLKGKTEYLDIDINKVIIIINFGSSYNYYFIVSTEEYDPSKHDINYLKEIEDLNITFSPRSKDLPASDDFNEEYEGDAIGKLSFNNNYPDALNLFPQISAGNKFIPFALLDEEKTVHKHFPEDKLLIYFITTSSHIKVNQIELLQKLYEEIKKLKNFEFELVDVIESKEISLEDLKIKFEFMQKFNNFKIDYTNEASEFTSRLY